MVLGINGLSTIGYDCGAKPFDEPSVTTFSLLDVHVCNIKTPYIETKTFLGQIV